MSLRIEEATLLSVDEAKKLLSIKDREYPGWWWLRSSGDYQLTAAGVYRDGSIDSDGINVYYGDGCVRPALRISLKSTDYEIGDTFSFGGETFKIISDDLAFCLESIGTYCFRKNWKAPDVSVYGVSDVKKFVDAWFEKAIAMKRRTDL